MRVHHGGSHRGRNTLPGAFDDGRVACRKTKRSTGSVTLVRERTDDEPSATAHGSDCSLVKGAVGVWLALLVFAVINGFFRQRVLEPELGEEVAHFLSTTTLCGAVFVAALLFVGNRPRLPSLRELLVVGLFWSIATVLFEVVLGLMSGRRSAPELFADYDLMRGRLFALVNLVEITAPPLVGWLRGWADRRSDTFISPRRS